MTTHQDDPTPPHLGGVSASAPPPAIERLTKRPQFLACARAPALARGALLVQMLDRADGAATVRAGFTATKKIGGAVQRNRAKRRMREAARALLPTLARPGCDYVFVARGGVTTRPWERLLDDARSALIGLAADQGRLSDRPLRPRRPGHATPRRPDSERSPRPDAR